QVTKTPTADAEPYVFPGPILRRMTPEQAWDSIVTLIAGPQLDEFRLSRSAVMREYALPTDQEVTAEAVLAKAIDLNKRKVPLIRSASGSPGDAAGPPAVRIGPNRRARASDFLPPAMASHFLPIL